LFDGARDPADFPILILAANGPRDARRIRRYDLGIAIQRHPESAP
jgi:hypothetical protein